MWISVQAQLNMAPSTWSWATDSFTDQPWLSSEIHTNICSSSHRSIISWGLGRWPPSLSSSLKGKTLYTVENLLLWCSQNSLAVETTEDFRKSPASPPIRLCGFTLAAPPPGAQCQHTHQYVTTQEVRHEPAKVSDGDLLLCLHWAQSYHSFSQDLRQRTAVPGAIPLWQKP